MKTPEEIKRGLACSRVCSDIDLGCKTCPYLGGNCPDVHSDALAYIQQLEQRVPRWISVEERLPENGVHVLVTAKTSGGRKYVCDAFHAEKFSISSEYGDELACEYNPEKDEYFLEEGWYEVIKNWDDYSSIVIQDQVTHWMPLPEPPDNEKKEGQLNDRDG